MMTSSIISSEVRHAKCDVTKCAEKCDEVRHACATAPRTPDHLGQTGHSRHLGQNGQNGHSGQKGSPRPNRTGADLSGKSDYSGLPSATRSHAQTRAKPPAAPITPQTRPNHCRADISDIIPKSGEIAQVPGLGQNGHKGKTSPNQRDIQDMRDLARTTGQTGHLRLLRTVSPAPTAGETNLILKRFTRFDVT